MRKNTIIIATILLFLIIVNFKYIKINIDPISCFNLSYKNLPRVKKNGKVVISFTTIPSRIRFSKYMIASLLNQTVRVDEICAYIPIKSMKGDNYIIPSWMTALSQHITVFKIKRCNKDWGPATKLIPALMEHGDADSIIYLDDDIIYNSDMIERLISYSNIYPYKAICNQGWNKERWFTDNTFQKVYKHVYKYLPTYNPYYMKTVDVLQGVSGVIVKPSFFDVKKLIEYHKYPSEVIFVDDTYISGHLNNMNVKRVSTEVHSGIPYLQELIQGFIFRSSPNSLSSSVNRDHKNDKITCECFKWT